MALPFLFTLHRNSKFNIIMKKLLTTLSLALLVGQVLADGVFVEKPDPVQPFFHSYNQRYLLILTMIRTIRTDSRTI